MVYGRTQTGDRWCADLARRLAIAHAWLARGRLSARLEDGKDGSPVGKSNADAANPGTSSQNLYFKRNTQFPGLPVRVQSLLTCIRGWRTL